MNVTALYDPATRCRSGPASRCFVSSFNNGATTSARNLPIQANALVIDRLNNFLRLMICQADHSTTSENHLIPIAAR